MGRSNNIYGNDDNSFAESISSAALSTTDGRGEEIWSGLDDPRSHAEANVGREPTGPTHPKVPVTRHPMAGGGDKEKLTSPYPQMGRFPRHVPGPKTSTDEGGGVKTPPPSNQTSRNGKQRSPAYSNETS